MEKIDNNDYDFSTTLGVCFRNEDGKAILNQVRPNIKDLDTLPYPAWDLLPMDIYFDNSKTLYSEDSFKSSKRIDIVKPHLKHYTHSDMTDDDDRG